MRSASLLVLAASLVASGCFAYVPSSPQELALGEGVRLRLTAAEAMRYSDLRFANPRVIEGELVERSDSALMVEASIGSSDPSRGTRIFLQRVAVPLSGVVDVESRHLDTFKTGLWVGGGAAAVAALVIHAAWGSGSDPDRPPDVPEARRIPLIRFAIPLGGG